MALEKNAGWAIAAKVPTTPIVLAKKAKKGHGFYECADSGYRFRYQMGAQ